MPSPHLYLVDGSSYIFRAFHRLPPLTNKHGLNVGAVYGYTTMLWKLADSLNKADGPTHLAVILDASESTHRNELYDQYKANRPPAPPELVPQFPLIRDATRAFSIPCIEEEGLEADDIIACYAKEAAKAGWQVTIVSSDKDLMQLVEDGKVDMLDTMNDRRIDSAYVRDKFGVGPEALGDVLALMGDKVDNIPGVPGIGPKTASQLIGEHGSLEAVRQAKAAGAAVSCAVGVHHRGHVGIARGVGDDLAKRPGEEPFGETPQGGVDLAQDPPDLDLRLGARARALDVPRAPTLQGRIRGGRGGIDLGYSVGVKRGTR